MTEPAADMPPRAGPDTVAVTAPPPARLDSEPPFFSVVITTYNRREIVQRCIDSVLAQDEPAQIVVVDDCSSDGTAAELKRRYSDRVDVVRHPRNRGITPARHTGVSHASGEWIVVLDSDWELRTGALTRLRELIAELRPNVRVIRARLIWDTGAITPTYIPDEVIGYQEYLLWLGAQDGATDSLPCAHRTVFDDVPYLADRRGPVEDLYELDLHRAVLSRYVPDILGHESSAAPNSYLRSAGPRVVLPRLLGDAADTVWMAETLLERHGPALRAMSRDHYDRVVRLAASRAFLSGDRTKGIAYSRQALRRTPTNLTVWMTLLVGATGRYPLAVVSVLMRGLSRLRGGELSPQGGRGRADQGVSEVGVV